MADPLSPRAAGAPLALAIVAGALIGTVLGEPTFGVLAGFGLGLAVALLVWWRDRRRGR